MAPALKQGLALISFLFMATASPAEDLDRMLEDFDRPSAGLTESDQPDNGICRHLDWSAALTLDQAYNYAHQSPQIGQVDHRGLTWIDPRLDLALKIDLPQEWDFVAEGHARGITAYQASRVAPGDYKISAEHTWETGSDEVYIEGRILPWLDIKCGRQIVTWGRADSISVTDVLNPLDLREPGLTPLKDLKLPTTISKMDAYFKNLSFSCLYLHEKRFSELPEFGSDFFPASAPFPPHNKPSGNLKNAEYGLSATALFKGFDISLYHASYHDRLPHLQLNQPSGILTLEHAELTMTGAAAAWAVNDLVFKFEGAVIDGLEYYAIPGRRKTRHDYLVGVDYCGIKNTVISIETANRRIDDYFYRLRGTPDYKKEDERTTALTVLTNLLRDTLHVSLSAQYYGTGSKVAVLRRLTGSYDITDNLAFRTGIVTYRETGNFDRVRDNDRIEVTIACTY